MIIEQIEEKYGEEVAGRAEKINSSGIQNLILKWGEIPEFIGANGKSGDERISLYRFPNGFEIANTNGDPVGEDEEGFLELTADCRQTI